MQLVCIADKNAKRSLLFFKLEGKRGNLFFIHYHVQKMGVFLFHTFYVIAQYISHMLTFQKWNNYNRIVVFV